MKHFSKRISSFALVLLLLASSLIPGTISAKAGEVPQDYAASAVDFPLSNNFNDYVITETDKSGAVDRWYRLTLPSDGSLHIRAMAYMNYLDIDLLNTDLSQTFIDNSNFYSFYGTSSSPVTKEETKILSAGTYYLKVRVGNCDVGKYRLSADFTAYTTNDKSALSYDSPQTLPIDSVINGALTETDKEDWFRLSIPKTGTYTFKVVCYQYGMNYLLYNQDMTTTILDEYYMHGTETAPATKTFDKLLSAGTYYIKVAAGDLGRYSISYSALTQSNCTHEYTTEVTYPTYFSRGYTTYTCSRCGHSYRGNYTAKNKLSTPTIFTAQPGLHKKSVYTSFSSSYMSNGYQIRYSTDKKMKKNVKSIKTKQTSYTIKKLKSKKRYYIQIRAYAKSGKKTAYSSWSSKKSSKAR